jgi:hypothetical protein
MSKHLTPLAVCERQFGSLSRIASICGCNEKAPYLWRRASKGRDAGDLPSTRYLRILLDHADEHAVVLDPVWLITGATEDEIAAEEGRAAAMARAVANCAPFRSSRSPEAAE